MSKSLQDRIAKLTPDQRKVFEAQLKAKNMNREKILPKTDIIPRRGHKGPSPLSFDQERLWFFHQMNEDKPTYNVYGAIRLHGTLHVEAMEFAINEVLRRHEAWRTTFDMIDGHPMQIVHEEMILAFDVADLREWPEASREEEARLRTVEEVLIPIDIVKGPCLRVKLISLSDAENILILTVHHLITDRVTFSIVFQELVMHYITRLQDRPIGLPEPPIQYADYAEWQRRHLTGGEKERLMNYWLNLLAGSDFVLELPTDFPRPPVQTFKGARHFLELPKPLGDRLKEFGTKEGATPFMVLMAVYKLLLYRWTAQEDIIVGTPLANRDRPEMENLLGYFLTSGVFRTLVQGGMTFRDLLARVRQHSLDAFEHAGLPFGLLLDELKPRRDPSRNPVFQAMFVYVDVPEQPMEFPDLKIDYELIDGETAKYDLTLCLIDRDGIVNREYGTECFLEYSPDLFEEETIVRMGEHFLNLVQAVVEHPDMPVAKLPMLTDGERELLDAWNLTDAQTSGRCLHVLFEEQAARTPDAAAVEFEDAQLTYRELNERANLLAHRLLAEGVRPDRVVGLCTERSFEMIVGMLAIQKAGGAYLPLDPRHPQDRLVFLLEDAGVELAVVQAHLEPKLAGLVATVRPEKPDGPEEQGSRENPVSGVTPDHLAYVIYTSGSTGVPKGVLSHHRGVANNAEANREIYDVEPGRRMLQFAAFTFDASVAEIYATLLHGGTIVLARQEQLLPGEELLSFLRGKKITNLAITPSLMAQFEPHDLPDLRSVVSVGEALSADVVKTWGVGRRFANAYGPTEVSVLTHFALSTPEERVPSIGRAIKNIKTYVLDGFQQRVPIGAVGELCIGGVGVSRGYLNRPELNEERFLPDPFSERPGARLYRTGDLVRLRRDGQLEYIGRVDHQVKVRGYRVELGEVEARIGEHELVRDVVAAALDDVTGTKRLAAYVVTAEGRDIGGELRGFLRERLPEFMVPSLFLFLDALPLNAHGKVDRSALPAPSGLVDELEASFVAPRNEIEKVLAGIWRELLDLNRVGVYTHFFDVGGHSLLATQMISRVRDKFRVSVPMKDLFEVGTIADIARVLAEHEPTPGHVAEVARLQKELDASGLQGEEREEALARLLAEAGLRDLDKREIVPVPDRTALPLSFTQARLWFLYQLMPEDPSYNITTHVKLAGHLDVDVLLRSFNEIVRRHETLRTNFRSVNGEPRLVVHEELRLDVPRIDLRHLEERERSEEVERLFRAEARKPFRLEDDPLIRAALLRLGEDEHVLFLTLHHIVSDGWSMGVFLQELGVLYEAFRLGQPSPLKELSIQYADYAAWQEATLQGEGLEEHASFWRELLKGRLPVLQLPTDRPRPNVRSGKGSLHKMSLPKELIDALTELGAKQETSLYQVLLAAFNVLLHRYTSQDDVLVGAPIANRNRSEVEGLIGFLANTVVFRGDLSGDPAFRDLLVRIRDMSRGVYAHQDMPFVKLVEAIQPDRNMASTPLFQVFFVLQNAPMPSLELPGLQLSLMEMESATAKFDLSLFIMEEGDGTIGLFEYSTDLFEAATIDRMGRHFLHLLEAIVHAPGLRISQLAMLGEDEEHLLRRRWSQGGPPAELEGGAGLCLHELFERQAARTPDAIAVVFEGQELTYGELQRRVNALAVMLQSRGVGPEQIVGICLERSPELVVALLGVLRAGGAYLPLDPHAPRERQKFLLEETETRLVITSSTCHEHLPQGAYEILLLDTVSWEAEPQVEPARLATLDSLAYVIYTSGSTGRPKGVLVPHRGVCNRLLWGQERYPLTAEDAVLQKTPYTFDVSVWEFFWPLLAGARLVLARPEGHLDPNYLIETIAREKITLAHFVPSMLAVFLEAKGLETIGSLRRVICSGEKLSYELQERFFSRVGASLHNFYGPTEASIEVIAWDCEPESARRVVPIGHPISGVEAYVLDGHMQPVPVGVPGELYLGGVCLARGYLKRPELTERGFIPHPFREGERLYRTGDIARVLADGAIDFMGRSDGQVKIRGFRVELGEIEAALLADPAIREGVVLLREDVPGEQRLVAYVVPAEGAAAPSVSDLRSALKEKLPDYMIPSACLILDEMPLTSSGKTDRGSLPAPGALRPVLAAEYVEPRNEQEARLAEIWKGLLGVERVGVLDNFFDLGGHSLKATQLIAQISDAFAVEIPLARLFEEPTVSGLAELVTAAQTKERREDEPVLAPLARPRARRAAKGPDA